MGKCYQITHFLDLRGISPKYSQPNCLIIFQLKKVSHWSHWSPQSHFAVFTMKDMALRKSPVRTAAMLAANRANAQKSTGPSTAQGKARVALNALRHGGRADCLPEKLLRAGDGEGEALYRWFRSAITATFGTGRPREERRADQIAAAAWCRARALVRLRTKPECPFVSWALCSRLHVRSRIQIMDGRRRIGLAFWVQRPRYWTLQRQVRVMEAEDLLGTPPRGRWLEQCWRRQRFRSHQPSPWEEWILKHEAKRRGRPAARGKPGRPDARPVAVPTRLLPAATAIADPVLGIGAWKM
jgi:hypothetical protein